MNCRSFRDALLQSKETERSVAELARHESECPECARFSARYAETRMLLETPANAAARPSPGFASRVVTSLPAPVSPLTWATVRLLPVTTALALTLLGWCWVATPPPGELWSAADQDEVLAWVYDAETDSAVETGAE